MPSPPRLDRLSAIPAEFAKRAQQLAGRAWVLRAIADWVENGSERFFLLTAEPGGGKSALAAWLAGIGPAPAAPEDVRRLERVRGAWRAMHFCFAEDRRGSVEPGGFSQDLAKQLAERVPDYGVALLQRAGATINIDQTATYVSGEMIALKAQTLIIGEQPERAYSLALREPLWDACDLHPDERVLILVDALDEAKTVSPPNIVTLLAGSDDFPPQVRFLLTSRNDDNILRAFKNTRRLNLSDAAHSAQANADVRAYVERRIADDASLHARLAGVEPPIDALVAQADGNFLYIKFLLDEIAAGKRSPRELTALPRGLDGLYRAYLDRVLPPETSRTLSSDRWLDEFQPLLGVLSVAARVAPRDVLPRWLDLPDSRVDAMLQDLAQLVENEGAGCRLYHRSMADYLARRDIESNGTTTRNRYYTPPREQHERIARYYLAIASAGWKDRDGNDCDDYGLRNAAVHFAALHDRAEFRGALDGLVSRELMEKKLGRFKSHESFVADVALAIDSAAADGIARIAQTIRATLVYATLVQQAGEVPDSTLYAMVRLGEADRALGYASLRSVPYQRWTAHAAIARGLLTEGDATRVYEMLERELPPDIARDDTTSAERRALLGQALLQLGRVEEGAARLRAGFGAVASYLPARALQDAVRNLCRSEAYDRALAAASAHVETVNEFTRQALLADVANAATTAGRFDDAWAAVAAMDAGASRRTNTVLELITTLARAGRVGEALARARALENQYERTRVLASVLLAAAERDGVEPVREVLAALADAAEVTAVVGGAAIELGNTGRGEQVMPLVDAAESFATRDTLLGACVNALAYTPAVEDALTVAARIVDPFQRRLAMTGVARTLAQRRNVDRALEVLVGAGEPQWESWDARTVLAAAVDAGPVDGALAAVRRHVSPEGQPAAFMAIARLLASRGETTVALRAAREVDEGITRDTLTPDAPLAKPSAWQEAAVTLARQGDIDSLVATIDGAGEAARHSQIEAIAPALLDALGEERTIAVARRLADAYVRGPLLRRATMVLARAGDAAGALRVAAAAPDAWDRTNAFRGLPATLVDTNGAARIWDVAAATLVGDALADFTEAVTTGPPRPVDPTGLPGPTGPSPVEFDDHALQVLRAVQDGKRKTQVLQAIVRQIAAARPDDALALAAMIPAGWEHSSALSEIAKRLAASGDVARARAIVDRVPDDSRPNAIAELARAVIQSGRVADANGIVASLPDDIRSVRPLGTIAEALVDAGDRARATDIVARTLRLVDSSRRDNARDPALHAIALALARAGKADAARGILPSIANQMWMRADALRAIAAALGAAGDLAGRRQVLDEARAVASHIESHESQASNVAALTVSRGKIAPDEQEKLETTLRAIEGDGEQYVLALCEIAHALVRTAPYTPPGGNATLMAGIAERIARWRARVLAASYAKRAAERAARLSLPGQRAAALARVSLAFGAARQAQDAARAAADAQAALSEAERGGDADEAALRLVLRALCRADDRSRATELLRRTLAERPSPHSPDEQRARARTYDAVAEAVGLFGAADDIECFVARVNDVERIQWSGIRPPPSYLWYPVVSLARALADAGRAGEAAALADRFVTAALEAGNVSERTVRLGDALRAAVAANRREAWDRGMSALLAAPDGGRKAEIIASAAESLASSGRDPVAAAKVAEDALASLGAARDNWRVLATIVEVFERTGRRDRAVETLLRAVTATRTGGREAIFEVLRRGAPTLAAIDGGATLEKVAREILEVESWWSAPRRPH